MGARLIQWFLRLFPAYRQMVFDRDRALLGMEQLEAQLQMRRSAATVEHAAAWFHDEVLVEKPFEGGKVPEDFYLTPPYDADLEPDAPVQEQ